MVLQPFAFVNSDYTRKYTGARKNIGTYFRKIYASVVGESTARNIKGTTRKVCLNGGLLDMW